MAISRDEIDGIYRRWNRVIWRIARRAARNEAEADDTLHEVFELLLVRADEMVFETENHAVNWLCQRARWHIKSAKHTRGVRREILMLEVKRQETPATQFTKSAAAEILAAVPHNEAVAAMLTYGYEMTLRDVAPQIGVSHQGVANHLARFHKSCESLGIV